MVSLTTAQAGEDWRNEGLICGINFLCMNCVITCPPLFPPQWLGIFGGMLMVLCMIRGIKASILWGILFVTFISW